MSGERIGHETHLKTPLAREQPMGDPFPRQVGVASPLTLGALLSPMDRQEAAGCKR